MAKPIARIYGTAVRPGVSRNQRYYSPEMIAAAVELGQARLAEGILPMTMLTHHGADDDGDTTRVVGRLAELRLEEDGSATFAADLADTTAGRDLLELIDTSGDQPPFLRGVSFRGDWIGPSRRIVIDGDFAVTADGFAFEGIDFTYKPGVIGAGVEVVERIDDEPTESRESAGRSRIYESIQEARVTSPLIEETAPAPVAAPAPPPEPAPAAPVRYADMGYRPDAGKQFPLDTAPHARAAFFGIRESETARLYTAAQLKRMGQRIRTALREHHTEATDGGYLITHQPITEAIAEMYGWEYDELAGHVYLTLDNGLVTISISSCRIDPHDLDRVARAAMDGACQALAVIDPDGDGDADPIGGEQLRTRPREEAPQRAGLTEADDDPAPHGAANPDEDKETPAVSEQPTPPAATPPVAAAPAPAGITLTDEQFAELLARLGPAPAAAAEMPAAAPATEQKPELVGAGAPAESATAAAPVTETTTPAALTEQRIGEIVAQTTVSTIQQMVASGQLDPGRKGFVHQPVTESVAAAPTADVYPEGWPRVNGVPKQPHELTQEESDAHLAAMTVNAVLGHRLT